MNKDEFDKLFNDDDEKIVTTVFTKSDEKSKGDLVLDGLDESEETDEEDDPSSVDLKKKGSEILNEVLEDEEEPDDEEESDDVLKNSPLHAAVNKLLELGKIQLFEPNEGEPEKELKDYTEEELVDLLSENIDEAIAVTAEQAPLALFASFPKSVKDVIHFTLNKADETQLKGLYQQLAKVQETLDLDPENEEDARKIIRQHLEAEGIETAEEIEDSISKIEDRGRLKEYSEKYKKILDAKQAAILKERLADQDKKAKEKIANDAARAKSYGEILSKNTIGAVELPVDFRKQLYYGLVNEKFQDDEGKNINEFDYLIKSKSKGTPEDMTAVISAFAYLKDPETFVSNLEKSIRLKLNAELQEQLKDSKNNNNGLPSSSQNNKPKPKRTLKKAPTVFTRN